MDDELRTARRYGTVRKLLWPHGRRHKGFMHGRRWMGAALILFVCALTVTGIAVSRGTGKAPPEVTVKVNEGVASLSDFFETFSDRMDILSAGAAHSLPERLLNEPFEISAQMTIESEALKSLGIPLTALPAELNIKYDLRETGIKMSAAGVNIIQACLSENQLTYVPMNGEQAGAKLSAVSDVSGDMTLENRVAAYLPLPSEPLMQSLLGVLAQSVPAGSAQWQLGRVYSPKDKKDVNVTLLNTELDDKALSTAAAAFAEQLKKDDALYEQIRKLTAQTVSLLDAKDVTLDSLLGQLVDMDQKGTTVSWKAFRRDEVPIGFAVNVQVRDTQIDFMRMAEFEDDTCYECTQVVVNGMELFRSDAVTQDDTGEFRVKTISTTGEPVSIGGTFELTKLTENAYRLTADTVAEGKLLSDSDDTAHVVIDANIDVGGDLGMMAASTEWQDIEDLKD